MNSIIKKKRKLFMEILRNYFGCRSGDGRGGRKIGSFGALVTNARIPEEPMMASMLGWKFNRIDLSAGGNETSEEGRRTAGSRVRARMRASV